MTRAQNHVAGKCASGVRDLLIYCTDYTATRSDRGRYEPGLSFWAISKAGGVEGHTQGGLMPGLLGGTYPLNIVNTPPLARGSFAQAAIHKLWRARLAHSCAMGTKSRDRIYGSSIQASAERAATARKQADRLACEAWNQRMLGYRGPEQPSPMLGDALNADYLYLEVRCLGCDTHQTVALDIVRRPKTAPIHELERYMRCRQCSELPGYPVGREELISD
jgi:hypothetical protein